MIVNFSNETLYALAANGHSAQDIDWIGNFDFQIPLSEFWQAAKNTVYNNGYGTAFIPLDLMIVMKDGSYYHRREYDGSEWWEYTHVFCKPTKVHHMVRENFLPENGEYFSDLKNCVNI